MYKALITDFDGTVVKLQLNNSYVDDLTVQSVHRAIDLGKKIACATGREWLLAKKVIDRLGLTEPCIIEGGARIINPLSGETIWEKRLEYGTPNQILQIFKANSLGNEFIVSSSEPFKQSISDVQSLPDDLGFVYLIGATRRVAELICKQIEQTGGSIAHNNPSWEGPDLINVHVTNRLADKGQAIEIWRQMQGIAKDEMIGIGDSSNDIPLLEATGFKVAVSNASDDLKAIASYIAPNENINAVSDVIQSFLIG